MNIKTFGYALKNSFINPSYYADVAKAKFSFSLKYLLGILFLANVVVAIVLSILGFNLVNKIPNFVPNLYTVLQDFYPQGLVIEVKDNKVSTNQPNPVYFDIPESFFTVTGVSKETEDYKVFKEYIEHIGVIDTSANADEFLNYKTLFLVTEDKIAYIDSDNSTGGAYQGIENYKVSKITGVEDTTITQSKYNAFLNTAKPYLQNLPNYAKRLIVGFAVAFPFLFTIMGLIYYLVVLVFYSLISLLLNKLLNKGYSFEELYKMGMHAVGYLLVINMATFFIAPLFPFLGILVFGVVMLVILSSLPSKGKNFDAPNKPVKPASTTTYKSKA